MWSQLIIFHHDSDSPVLRLIVSGWCELRSLPIVQFIVFCTIVARSYSKFDANTDWTVLRGYSVTVYTHCGAADIRDDDDLFDDECISRIVGSAVTGARRSWDDVIPITCHRSGWAGT